MVFSGRPVINFQNLNRSHIVWAITSVKHSFLSLVKNESKNESLIVLLIKIFDCYDYIWLPLWIFDHEFRDNFTLKCFSMLIDNFLEI